MTIKYTCFFLIYVIVLNTLVSCKKKHITE